jgi:hypothetical protein
MKCQRCAGDRTHIEWVQKPAGLFRVHITCDRCLGTGREPRARPLMLDGPNCPAFPFNSPIRTRPMGWMPPRSRCAA